VTDLLRVCPQRAHDVPFPHPKYMLHSVSAAFEQENRTATEQVAEGSPTKVHPNRPVRRPGAAPANGS
jgi:hypothetical protein